MGAVHTDSPLERLERTFAGQLLRPGDQGYEEARRVHNGLVDRRPALVARCTGTADVIAAVRYGNEERLEIAVRGGGHSVAGLSTVDDGLVIDLSLLKGVDVDPDARVVRAQAGATWHGLNRETAVHGLAVTGGTVSTTGIAGLTLGGGFGWLMGAHGLAADNLLSAQVVTADGSVLTASAERHPDLFWALRGGGTLGVVTSFTYRLHPVDQVLGGLVAHPFTEARAVLRLFRELAESAPDELGLVAALVHAPDGSGAPLAAVALCHCGDPAQAERAVAPILEHGAPVLSQVGRLPYPEMNTLLDDSYPAGALNYWKSSFVAELSDDVIEILVDRFPAAPSGRTVVAVEHHHGAVTRVGIGETAVPHRMPGFNVLLTSVWLDPDETEDNVRWTRGVYDALRPFLAKRRYVNYLDVDDGDEARAAYGPNLERLADVRHRYDPEGVFRRTVGVSLSGGA